MKDGGKASEEGYGAFSVSKSEESNVVRYIRDQEHHHRKRDFKEEYLAFLDKYRVEYDERYLWDWSYRVGPTGLESSKLKLVSRPDGRGYFMPALRDSVTQALPHG